MASVIVFGPTGNVGSFAARTAQECGAKVYLAMRDTSKTIPGLSSEQEKIGGFERVTADLTKPNTVSAAVEKTGAKRAFIYLAHGAPDHMKSTIQALKSTGIEFVVFLSSFTVHGDPKQFTPQDAIPYVHAQVELVLDEVYGDDNYVAIRPGGFATNLLRYTKGIQEGEVRIFGGAHKFDCITPDNMGQVSGTILAEGKARNGQKKVYLYGPKEYSQTDGIKVIAKVLGKSVEVNEVKETEGRELFKQAGFPPPLIEYMIRMFNKPADSHGSRTSFDEGVKNVELYTGKPSLALEDWVKANTGLFAA